MKVSALKIPALLFRFRRWVLLAIVILGFWAPWERMGGTHPGSTWLYLASLLAHATALSIADSIVAVMAVAILFALLAALLRTWATAYLGRGVVHDAALHGEQLVADGPYRYVRNPLYLGMWFNMLALAVLMPPTGALFTIVAAAALNGAKARAEERVWMEQGGERYREYRRRVPRFFCSPVPRVVAGGVRPNWGDGFLGEIYPWGVFLTYLLFASRYNATILEQGVLISFGISLIVQGILRPRARAERFG